MVDDTQKHKNNIVNVGSQSSDDSSRLIDKAGDVVNNWMDRNRSMVLRQTPVWAQAMTGAVVALGGIVVLGSIFFRIDEVVTVQGQLKSIGGTVEVKTPAGGRIAEIFFSDGESVAKDQLLVRFDTSEALDEKETLTRMIALEENELISRLETLKSQANMLASRKDVLNQKLSTKTQIINELEKLAFSGGYQRLQLLEKKDQLFSLQEELNELDEQFSQLKLQEDQMKLKTRKNIDQMKSSLKKAELQLLYRNVVAPVSGIVFDPKAYLTGVLSPGERILSLVPQAGLYAEVFVPNKDVGFVKKGQKTKVRVDAFPYSRYGELDGKVLQIGADALTPTQTMNYFRFPVKIKLDSYSLSKDENKIPLMSGMAITANLKLREKRIISLVSDLLVDQTDSVKSIRQQ